ncbi:MAG TPA: tRNA preQ1(34) S-adenosylmethionine ribosyltransferase-isomerase QueA [Thermoanaerobaculia bacterium]|nr:tRNA preQ1(34) S-adenosylmethionine ribosyltransferase-isomerase QueA [Thermoanaerobaculia bacterium]
MRTLDFDYELPEERIARAPVERGSARLLVLDAPPAERHRRVSDLPSRLRPGDLVVVNDTRVLPARLHAVRTPSGGRVELLLLGGDEPTRWRALARPAKKLRPGVELRIGGEVAARVEACGSGGVRVLRFSAPVAEVLERFGEVPLPPYLGRPAVAEDREWYQTVYARVPGAVAAPTAGLHLTREMLAELDSAGIECAQVTLHVGAGTFKPVVADRVEDHHLDAEPYALGEEACRAIERTRARGGRIVAIGTTVVRCLESAALAPGMVSTIPSASHDLGAADGAGRAGSPVPGARETDLFIRPGFRFQVVDVLLTNFHLPRSTLLMLVAAFAGTSRVLAAYHEAIERGYRFYSYGDAMLAERRPRRQNQGSRRAG